MDWTVVDWTVTTYITYLLIAVPLTIWVARTLTAHGKAYLEDVFQGSEASADAVNRLLVVGFYLVNLGFVSLFMRSTEAVRDLRGLFELLSVKIGLIALLLGLIHFINVWIFNGLRRRQRIEAYRAATAAQYGAPAYGGYTQPTDAAPGQGSAWQAPATAYGQQTTAPLS